LKNVQVDRKNP